MGWGGCDEGLFRFKSYFSSGARWWGEFWRWGCGGYLLKWGFYGQPAGKTRWRLVDR